MESLTQAELGSSALSSVSDANLRSAQLDMVTRAMIYANDSSFALSWSIRLG